VEAKARERTLETLRLNPFAGVPIVIDEPPPPETVKDMFSDKS